MKPCGNGSSKRVSGACKTGLYHTGPKTKNDQAWTLCAQAFFCFRKHGAKTAEELKTQVK